MGLRRVDEIIPAAQLYDGDIFESEGATYTVVALMHQDDGRPVAAHVILGEREVLDSFGTNDLVIHLAISERLKVRRVYRPSAPGGAGNA